MTTFSGGPPAYDTETGIPDDTGLDPCWICGGPAIVDLLLPQRAEVGLAIVYCAAFCSKEAHMSYLLAAGVDQLDESDWGRTVLDWQLRCASKRHEDKRRQKFGPKRGVKRKSKRR